LSRMSILICPSLPRTLIIRITASPAGSVPSLTHSASSSSGHTLAEYAQDPGSANASPSSTYPPRMHSSSKSTTSFDMLSMMTRTKHMTSTPNSPEYPRSTTPDSRRNSTLDLARASHLREASSNQGETVGRMTRLADGLEKVAPK
jgi:hypothetical protein